MLTITARSTRLVSMVAIGITEMPAISGLFAPTNITITASVQTNDMRVAFFSVARDVAPNSGTICIEEPIRSIPIDPYTAMSIPDVVKDVDTGFSPHAVRL